MPNENAGLAVNLTEVTHTRSARCCSPVGMNTARGACPNALPLRPASLPHWQAAVRKKMRMIVDHFSGGSGAELAKTQSVRSTEAQIKHMQEHLTMADYDISITPKLGDV